MSIDLETLEKRLTAMETAVAEIQRRMGIPPAGSNWVEQLAGSMKDIPEEEFWKIVEYGRTFRWSDRPPDREELNLAAQADIHSLKFESVDPECRDAAVLLAELEYELGYRYGDEGKGDFTPDLVRVLGGVFLVAKLGDVAVGCGAVRPLEASVGEVKRMFVERIVRGRGIAGRILTELEARARAMGYRALRLETGVRQPEAIRVYERGGYRRIERYGKYSHNPLSVCFEKALD